MVVAVVSCVVAQIHAEQKGTWDFPKIRGTLLGVSIIRTIVFGGPYWGPLILENYHMKSPSLSHATDGGSNKRRQIALRFSNQRMKTRLTPK